jgi:hypothetical protein
MSAIQSVLRMAVTTLLESLWVLLTVQQKVAMKWWARKMLAIK